MDEASDKVRVLLVDDEPEFLWSTEKVLVRRGFEVCTALSGPEALSALEAQSVHVAVLDVKMPGIDGYELFRRIRIRHPDVQVIILTGHGAIDKAFELSREGVFEYLAKPIDTERLAVLIRSAHDAAQVREGRPAVPPPGAAEEVRVLLVDDEEEYLESMSRVLARRGMSVLVATSAEAALETLADRPIDVAVVDIKMPGMGGLELLARIRERGTQEVILLTGHATVGTAVLGMKKGAFDYLLKPQDPDDLASLIRAAAHRKAERDRARRSREIEDIIRRRPG